MELLRRLDRRLIRYPGMPWLWLTRERSIQERFRYCLAVLEDLDLDSPSVIDVGCGSGLLLRFLQQYRRGIARYSGIDHRIDRLSERYAGSPVPHEFREVPLDSEWTASPADFAWCSEVLEHLFEDATVMRRIAAAVRPGGHVAVTVPSQTFLENMAPQHEIALAVSTTQDGGHVRVGYTRQSLTALAEGAGLRVLRVDAVSPRTSREYGMRHNLPYLVWQATDRVPMAGEPPYVFGADDGQLGRYASIAAVMQRPAGKG